MKGIFISILKGIIQFLKSSYGKYDGYVSNCKGI
jgi:hypothetical protein